ncbi:unnamed protein product [Ilex paraguariensis]|uniref:HIRAN domain-containing protein n=1 Tax=Ilex paraguariensis TaxID=185542 RepID=A0ABC8USZ6_9AQUA
MEAKPIDSLEPEHLETIKMIRSVIGPDISELDIVKALSQCNNDPDKAINYILDTPCFSSPPLTVKRTVNSTGGYRISTTQIKTDSDKESEEIKPFDGSKMMVKVKEEPDVGLEGEGSVCVKKHGVKLTFDEFLQATNTKVEADDDYINAMAKEERAKESEECKVKEKPDLGVNKEIASVDGIGLRDPEKQKDLTYREWLRLTRNVNQCKEEERPEESRGEADFCSGLKSEVKVKDESNLGLENKLSVKEESKGVICAQPVSQWPIMGHEYRRTQMGSGYNMAKPVKERVVDNRLSTVVIEDGDFPEEPDWLLVGRTPMTGLLTTKGRKLENNEIVHFAFRSSNSGFKNNIQWIVRFSTKRSGEIGRLPMEWAKCLIPLVRSSKVKVYGRCIAAPSTLQLMQEIMLYVSFYIHHSVFTAGDESSWKLGSPSTIDSTIYPLLTLFKLLKFKPRHKADFSPEELDSRKRSLNLEGDSDETASMLAITKRRNGCQEYPEQKKDEQDISESSLNKLVGAADVYNLEEMDPPDALMCDLRPYQKQALNWMSGLEKGVDIEKAAKTLHPCWAEYSILDE